MYDDSNVPSATFLKERSSAEFDPVNPRSLDLRYGSKLIQETMS